MYEKLFAAVYKENIAFLADLNVGQISQFGQAQVQSHNPAPIFKHCGNRNCRFIINRLERR
ncbi:hypothetical protein D3C75_562520 [compost metagenome]